MTPIDYIHIPGELLYRQDLPCAAKIILGLIQGFGDKGSMLSNPELGRIIGVKPVQISRLINHLIANGIIDAKNPKSKYRKLFYIIKNDKVETNLHYHLGQDTLSKKARYFIKNDKHNLRTKELNGLAPEEPVGDTAGALRKLGFTDDRIAALQTQGFEI